MGRPGAGERSASGVKSSAAHQPRRCLRLYRRPLLVSGTLRGTEVFSGGLGDALGLADSGGLGPGSLGSEAGLAHVCRRPALYVARPRGRTASAGVVSDA